MIFKQKHQLKRRNKAFVIPGKKALGEEREQKV
jgi:hypothetical protein